MSALDSGDEVGRTDLDSHADSPVVGINAKILSHTGKHVNVWGFSKALGSKPKVPVVNAAVTYTCEYTGESIILLVNNALYFEDMKHNLIPPFMIRLAGAEVNECPKCLSKYPKIEDHSIYFPDGEESDEGTESHYNYMEQFHTCQQQHRLGENYLNYQGTI